MAKNQQNNDHIGNLVLSRKPGQSIQIGSDVLIEVVDIRGNVACLKITAPKAIKIWRTELIPNQEKG